MRDSLLPVVLDAKSLHAFKRKPEEFLEKEPAECCYMLAATQEDPGLKMVGGWRSTLCICFLLIFLCATVNDDFQRQGGGLSGPIARVSIARFVLF